MNQSFAIYPQFYSREENAGENMYMFKDEVKVGILGMVDDQMSVTRQGIPAHSANSLFNMKSSEKRLQFSEEKSVQMIVRNNHEKSNFVDNLIVNTGKEEIIHGEICDK